MESYIEAVSYGIIYRSSILWNHIPHYIKFSVVINVVVNCVIKFYIVGLY